MFASSASGAHPVHCLRRDDVIFFDAEEKVLTSMQWQRATRVEVRFRGHKGDQNENGPSVIRIRDNARGTRSQIGAGGGAVAELTSCHMALRGSAPLCSYRRKGGEAGVLGYNRALKALRQIVARTGTNPKHVGLHSLRIGAATTMAAGGIISERIVQREGRWKVGSGTSKIYSSNNLDTAGGSSHIHT